MKINLQELADRTQQIVVVKRHDEIVEIIHPTAKQEAVLDAQQTVQQLNEIMAEYYYRF